MPKCRAEAPTELASRYLQQLCKHWGHKFAVTFTPAHGEIILPFGPCVLDADDEKLTIMLSSEDAETLPRFQSVVEEHIRRFAFREQLTFAWTDVDGRERD